MLEGGEKCILALDLETGPDCEKLADSLHPYLKIVKVGSVLFCNEGPSILDAMSKRGFKIFLDLKFHDIPNTVAGCIRAICKSSQIEMMTVHASGGPQMILAAKAALEDACKNGVRPKLLAVTILTSLDAKQLSQTGFSNDPLQTHVERLARMALESGADGVVCSTQEVALLRSRLPREALLVVPGIRFEESTMVDDQKRAGSPKQALADGADYLVVGRPIYASPDPRRSFQRLLTECQA